MLLLIQKLCLIATQGAVGVTADGGGGGMIDIIIDKTHEILVFFKRQFVSRAPS